MSREPRADAGQVPAVSPEIRERIDRQYASVVAFQERTRRFRRDELETMLIYLKGYTPEAVEAALVMVERDRERSRRGAS